MSIRFFWVDILKVMGILTVILGHISNPFNNIIYSFHMPLFFALSGFFLNDKNSIKVNIIKDWNRLMIPYFIFGALGVFVETLKRYFLSRPSLDYSTEFISVFYDMSMESLSNSYAFVLWFLPALFLSKLFLYSIIKLRLPVFFEALIVLALFLFSFVVELPFAINFGLNGVFYLYFGYLFFLLVKQPEKSYNNEKIACLLLIAIASVCYVNFSFGVPLLDIAKLEYKNLFVNTAFSLSVIIIMSTVCIVLSSLTYVQNKAGNIISFISINSMALYVFHPYTNNISSILIDFFYEGNISWVLRFLLSILLLVFLLFIKKIN
ncbi:acyltransferase family protein, partial [Vibrio sp. 10N.222.52.B7]|uniref:acyltransferase family protein n=1 Tax=Vibrio sp. 10N.222.52.B7 TaxID=3229629 RepID=UPI00354B71BB